MSRRAALVLAFALVTVVRAIPLDEMSAPNDIGGSSEFSSISLPKTSSEDAGERHGAVVSLEQLPTAEGNELSRVDGTASGENHPAFIELDSDNVGQSGKISGTWLGY